MSEVTGEEGLLRGRDVTGDLERVGKRRGYPTATTLVVGDPSETAEPDGVMMTKAEIWGYWCGCGWGA